MEDRGSGLGEICRRIPERENAGGSEESRAFFEGLLAESFAFRRAKGVIVDRQAFMDSLADGGDRTVVDEPNVELVGQARATARFTVAMTIEGAVRHFDNFQLFVRDQAGAWRLLAWANEEAPTG